MWPSTAVIGSGNRLWTHDVAPDPRRFLEAVLPELRHVNPFLRCSLDKTKTWKFAKGCGAAVNKRGYTKDVTHTVDLKPPSHI